MTRIAITVAGAVETEAYFTVLAETSRGERYVLVNGIFPTEERAERFAAKVAAKGDIDLQYWADLHPAYGSEAWHEENELAVEAAALIRAGNAHEDDFAGTSIGTLL